MTRGWLLLALGFFVVSTAPSAGAASPDAGRPASPTEPIDPDAPAVQLATAPSPFWSRFPANKGNYAVYERHLSPNLSARMRAPVTDAPAVTFIRNRASGFRLRGTAMPLVLHTDSTVDIGTANPDATRLVSLVDLSKSPGLLKAIGNSFRVGERRFYINAMLTTGLTRDDNASAARGRTLYLPTDSLVVTVAAKNHRRVAAWSLAGDRWIKLWDVDPRTAVNESPERLLAQAPDRRGRVYYGGYRRADLAAQTVADRWIPASSPSIGGLQQQRLRRPAAASLLDVYVGRASPATAQQSPSSAEPAYLEAPIAVVAGIPIPMDNAQLATVMGPADVANAREAWLAILQEQARLREEAAAREQSRLREQAIAAARQREQEAAEALADIRNAARYGSPVGGICTCLPTWNSCLACCAGQAAAALAVVGNIAASCHSTSDLCPWCQAGCGIASAIMFGAVGGQTAGCVIGCSTPAPNQCQTLPEAAAAASGQGNDDYTEYMEALEQAAAEADMAAEELEALLKE